MSHKHSNNVGIATYSISIAVTDSANIPQSSLWSRHRCQGRLHCTMRPRHRNDASSISYVAIFDSPRGK